MLLELLLAVPLPTLGPVALPTPLLDGLENFLFTGRFATQQAEVTVSAGAALARLLQAARALDPSGRCMLFPDAQEPLLLLEPEAPLPDLAELPEGWQKGLSEGSLTCHGRTDTLEFSLSARFLDRVSPGEPALRISMRAIARALWPEVQGIEPSTAPPPDAAPASDFSQPSTVGRPDPTFEEDLHHYFCEPDRMDQLRTHLLNEGERCRNILETHLQPLTDAPIERLARVLILPELERAGGLLRGFSPEARRVLHAVGQSFQILRPSTQEVYHLTSTGLDVWRGNHR